MEYKKNIVYKIVEENDWNNFKVRKSGKPGRPKIHINKICLRCKVASNSGWRKGPEDCCLCNKCGKQYENLENLLHEYSKDFRYITNINPFQLVISVFMEGGNLSIHEYRFFINSFSSINKDQENILYFKRTGLILKPGGNNFSLFQR
ncbi:hypothetical protein DICPUDRAFT_78095 [Dictyostelium purpureum]|uniref:GATA-type domain-containing protein n=1 Tax=Dictyostelium purpureum TaxID=5786 RepID=F0ZIJ8_DICPU|nr:uncharacterized protein DICPUDRAFT_78095 [Dictyostelium purpureum]EGC36238.1 hypothetical protein DICPUDRAFT_78095 [Dictyostelium purpureum]|eukprot:XP_003287247.1 hypothetical protein DICPUDRAFT_78095 [Dictyostelium purpureum]